MKSSTFTLLFSFLISTFCSAQNHFNYVLPVYQTQVYDYGLKFDKIELKLNGKQLFETVVDKSDKLKISLTNPKLKAVDSSYNLLMGFHIYNENDSLLGSAPDLYGGKTIPSYYNLDHLTFTFTFKGVKEDSANLKIVMFGKDKNSGDSFSLMQPLTIVNHKNSIDVNDSFGLLYRWSINRTEEIVVSPLVKVFQVKQLQDKKKRTIKFSIKGDPITDLEIMKVVGYDDNGNVRYTDGNAKLKRDGNDYLLVLGTKLNPKELHSLHWELKSKNKAGVQIGGQIKLNLK